MTDTEARLLREIARLRHDVQALGGHLQRRNTGRYGWASRFVKDLEYNPHTQYRIHLVAVWFWVVNLPFVICLFVFLPDLWLQIGVFITLLYSLWANFATDYGSMSAALAAASGTGLPEIPTEPIAPHT